VVASRPELKTALRTKGAAYEWWVGVLNAAAYGLPQSRQRTVVVGYHRDLQVTPTPTPPSHAGVAPVWDYGSGELVVPSTDTLDQLLAGAPRLDAGSGRHRMSDLYTTDLDSLPDLVTVGTAIGDLDGAQVSSYARALGAGSSAPRDHEPWGHRPETVERLAGVPEGGRPEVSRSYFSQAYGRLHRKGLARTVTTNFHNPGSGRFWHYCRNRTVTIREAARLQGFRDDFILAGTRPEQERQIGNAFPRIWAEAIAAHIWSEVGSLL
jgi:DNA (cytosine-5)-methyltransferase 1